MNLSDITDWRDGVERACDDFDPTHDIPYRLTKFIDIDEATVSVGLSSSAMRECCRVWIEPHPEDTVERPTPSGIVHPALTSTNLHLCRCMAAELRDTLNRAFNGTLDEQPNCSEKDPEKDTREANATPR